MAVEFEVALVDRLKVEASAERGLLARQRLRRFLGGNQLLDRKEGGLPTDQ